MFRNHLKVAFRNLVRHKPQAMINILGLSAGMAVALLIGLWIVDEWSYNRDLPHHDRVARVMQNQTFDGEVRSSNSIPRQLVPELRNNYGRYFKYVVLSSGTGGHTLTVGENKITQQGSFMDTEAPELLRLTMIKGNRKALESPNGIILSESAAKSVFGSSDPIGQRITVDTKMELIVSGIYKDWPAASHFSNTQFIAPWDLFAKTANLDERQISWGNNWFEGYVELADNIDMATASLAIKDAKQKNVNEENARYKPAIFLHPMNKWHLYGEFKNGLVVGGRIQHLWLFGTIGIFVLILACINFMNLSTARSEKRAKEVGIRKAIGSLRGQLISQFFSESLLIAFCAFVLCLLMVLYALPWFNTLSDKAIQLPWTSLLFWLAATAFTIFTGLIAGLYPALYLSSFRPVSVLKGTFRSGVKAALPRKVLVVLQFTVSMVLIIGTIVVYRQIQFAKDRQIGYDRYNLVSIPVKTPEVFKHFSSLEQELKRSGAVKEITKAQGTPINAYVTNGGLEWKGKPPGMQDEFVTIAANYNFGKTIGWTISKGRDFSVALPTDSFGLVINETAVKYMQFKEAIGQPVQAFKENYQVIGVVKDMVMQSPYEPVKPMIFYIDRYKRVNNAILQLNPHVPVSKAMATVAGIFKKYDPENPFEYRFGDAEYDAKFREEERMGNLSVVFATLAIFISCLGLYGMAAYMAERRTKEIGVRKVLGASVFNLWQLLSKDFVLLVLISFCIATPLAYYFMHGWLQQFSYRTNLAWWIFAITGAGSILITLLTISYQSIKAALTNPVKSLKTE